MVYPCFPTEKNLFQVRTPTSLLTAKRYRGISMAHNCLRKTGKGIYKKERRCWEKVLI
jgi:hypothetical protein